METAQVEADKENFQELKSQLETKRNSSSEVQGKSESEEEKASQSEKKEPDLKKFIFKKGDSVFEVDEDAEIEMMADKKPVKLTLKDLKERAAGEIAVKNRMHSLAEEKKKVQSTLKKFSEISKEDPIGALEYLEGMAKDSDTLFEHKAYLQKLGEQAEKLAKMTEPERKAQELEKKLQRANEDLSLKERETAVVQKKQEILSKYEEIGDQQFSRMVDAVLESEELMKDCKDEMDVMATAEKLVQETLLQADISSLIHEIEPKMSRDDELIFALRDQVVQNPDLDEEDVREIIREILKPSKKEVQRVLSDKQRSSSSLQHMREQDASDFDLLKAKLEERKKTANAR
ncbi:MAG TPA: hypothetical protein VFO37_04815 [Chitinophagaceae bacterium]|nr:hypothetical protein [Chitinophagaceae bacterium]